MPVQTQMQVRRGTASSWTSTNPTLAAGELGFETDTGKFKIGTGSSTWTGLAYATGLNAITYLYNATGGQTTFSGADANGLTLAYTVGTEQVFLNGALQVRGSDYTATNGTSIVLTSGALASDVLNVIAYGATTITDTYTQAQADAKFVQQTTNFFAGKNRLLNGDFAINARNFTSVSSGYGFDRWLLSISGDGTSTYTPQTFTPGAAPVAGYEAINFARIVTTGQTSATVRTQLVQRIEDVRTFAGQTVTFSFWAKAATGTPKVGGTFLQNFGTGGSPSGSVFGTGQVVTISTSWARYSFTFALPSLSGKTFGTDLNSSYLGFFLGTSAGTDPSVAWAGPIGIQSATIDFWGVQLEAGSVATPFETATGTIQGELAACQRYYQRFPVETAFGNIAPGQAVSTTLVYAQVPLKTTMRVAPSVLDRSGTQVSDYNTGFSSGTFAIYTNGTNSNIATISYTHGSAALTQFRPYTLCGNGATDFIGLGAEL
jgi:hypothetical protein